MSEETALAVKEESSLTESRAAAIEGDWAFTGDSADILVPRLLIGQPTSEIVQRDDSAVTLGQIYRTTNGEPLGGKGKPISFIPLAMNKTWVISKKRRGAQGKFDFAGIEPFTPANKDEAWEWSDNEFDYKREANQNFFVLLTLDIEKDRAARKALEESGEMPDLDASLLPCVLSFKSTSYKVGKTLSTHFAKASDYRVPPFISVFTLDTVAEKNEKGNFYVFKLDKAGKTSEHDLTLCRKWYDIVSKSSVRIDDESNVAEPMPVGPQQF